MFELFMNGGLIQQNPTCNISKAFIFWVGDGTMKLKDLQ